MTNAAFLLAALRMRFDPSAAEIVRAGASALEGGWESLCATINAERVGPLLHRNLGALDIVPPAVRETLRQSYRVSGLNHVLLFHELGEGLRALAAADVPVVVLKGAALADAVYGNAAVRPMCDVDLLVRRGDLAAARRAFEGLGFGLARAETHPGALAEHENEVVLCKAGPIAAFVDLHWSLFDSPYYQQQIAMDWFWDTALPVRVADMPAKILGPEAQIIHLCGHLGLHHASHGLLWWNDVAEVLVRYRDRIDWPALLRQTERNQLVLPVRDVLTRAAAEWKAPVPGTVLERLRSTQPSPAERLAAVGFSAAGRPAGRRFWADLAAMPGWRPRLRFARTNLFPSLAYMRERYKVAHPLLLPLYYPYRWLRGLLGLR
jgi:hypothetical protein